MSNELEKFISDHFEAFNNKTPDPAVLERIQKQMGVAGKKKAKVLVIPIRVVRWAAACIVLLAGAGIFWIAQQKQEPVTTAKINGNKPAQQVPANTAKTTIPGQEAPITDQAQVPTRENRNPLEEELALRKQVMFAKLTDMQSPSQRLTAATLAYQLKNTDKEIVDALVNTMNTDPNTNVRLAALDALTKFRREKYVKKQLIGSLQKQKDPMVQIELIQILTRMKETTILDELDKIVNDDNTLKAVKDHAYSSIFTLRS